jgi:Uma2 family endonuclease
MVADPAAPWAETVLLTADDLLGMDDDFWHYELVRGRLVRMSPAGLRHGDVALRFAVVLGTFVNERRLGRAFAAETGFLVSRADEPDTVLAPDAAFVSNSRLPPPGSPEWDRYPKLAPDLVVEVASPSQGRKELGAKARSWLDGGVRLVWLVWPESREVEIYEPGQDQPVRVLRKGERLDGGDVLPGFTLELAQLWD